MSARFRGWLIAVAEVALAASVHGQTAPAPFPPRATTTTAPERPGLFRLGPVWVTPRFRLGTLGLDTNVFYTATERRTDFTASGGPELELLAPARSARFLVRGALGYLYFARTEEQRRLTGNGLARFELGRGRLRLGVFESYDRQFQRPGYEVTTRVDTEAWSTGGDLALDVSARVEARFRGGRTRTDVPRDQVFQGVGLGDALTRDDTFGLMVWRFGLTPKTWFVTEGEAHRERHPRAPERDGDVTRLAAGFELVSATRLDGRLVAGAMRFSPEDRARFVARTEPFVSATLGYRFGPRTRLWAEHRRDLATSVFTAVARSPTLRTHATTAGLEKGFGARVDLRSFGTYAVQTSDGPIALPGSPPGTREDEVWEAGANLGYRIGRLRVGAGATYQDRRSTFADFGLRGLLVGGTVAFNPD